MMTRSHKRTATASTQRVCAGSLTAHVDKFAEFLIGEGYASQTVKTKYALVVDLSHWLKNRGLPLATLDETRLKQFTSIPMAQGGAAMYLPAISYWSICAASGPFMCHNKR
jgi:hypothetical protein